MNIDKKIKAFTLSEMVVVLVLSSIVVGLAFSVLSLVQKHMIKIQDNFKKNTELHRLEQSLSIDFNRYSKVKFNTNTNEMYFLHEMDTTLYKFHDDYIVKTSDTFQIKIQHKTIYFLGDSIYNGELDALKLKTSKEYKNQKLFVYKENSAIQFMNGL